MRWKISLSQFKTQVSPAAFTCGQRSYSMAEPKMKHQHAGSKSKLLTAIPWCLKACRIDTGTYLSVKEKTDHYKFDPKNSISGVCPENKLKQIELKKYRIKVKGYFMIHVKLNNPSDIHSLLFQKKNIQFWHMFLNFYFWVIFSFGEIIPVGIVLFFFSCDHNFLYTSYSSFTFIF